MVNKKSRLGGGGKKRCYSDKRKHLYCNTKTGGNKK
nr:MAG TPA: hypothetical protein [Caudoviricetes sp.]